MPYLVFVLFRRFIFYKYFYFERCIALFDGDEIVQVEKKAKKNDEECDKFEGAGVCVSKYNDKKAGVYACQLSIDDMNEDLVGK